MNISHKAIVSRTIETLIITLAITPALALALACARKVKIRTARLLDTVQEIKHNNWMIFVFKHAFSIGKPIKTRTMMIIDRTCS